MRISVSYKVKKIDIAYRMKVYGLIKEAIKLSSKEYYEKLFIHLKNKMKPFTFATYLRNFEFKNDAIDLDEITIIISSPDLEFSVHVFNGIRQLKHYQIGNVDWIQSRLIIHKEKEIVDRKVIFRTLSPLLIEDKNGKPLSPKDSNFELEMNYYADMQISTFAGRNLYEPLTFTPIRFNKRVIKEKNRYLDDDRYLFFTCYHGIFCLEGNPRDLNLIYKLGIGKRSTYFGMLEFEGEGVQYGNFN